MSEFPTLLLVRIHLYSVLLGATANTAAQFHSRKMRRTQASGS